MANYLYYMSMLPGNCIRFMKYNEYESLKVTIYYNMLCNLCNYKYHKVMIKETHPVCVIRNIIYIQEPYINHKS